MKAPGLKLLIIAGYLHSRIKGCGICECLDGYECLCESRIEELRISGFYRSTNYNKMDDMLDLSNFLAKCACLRLVEITCQVVGQEEQDFVVRDIRNLYKKSKDCNINVTFGELVI